MLRIATKPMCCEDDFSIIRYAQLKPMARMRITHHNLLKKMRKSQGCETTMGMRHLLNVLTLSQDSIYKLKL